MERALRKANRLAKRRKSKGHHNKNNRMREVNEMRRVFSVLKDESVDKMSHVMINIILPSLIQFENLVGSHITGLRSTLISQELRLEQLEKISMERASHTHAPATPKDLQNDQTDNKTKRKEIKIKDDIDGNNNNNNNNNNNDNNNIDGGNNNDDNNNDSDNGDGHPMLTADDIYIKVQVFGKEDGGSGDEELDSHLGIISSTTNQQTDTTTSPPSTSVTTTQPPTTKTTPAPNTTTTTTQPSTTPTTTPPPTTTPTTTTTTTPTTTTTTTTTTMETTTTSTTTEKPQNDANYEELYQFFSILNQKMDALHNHNVMSATELQRYQTLVIKMDDKVTELERTFKNLQTRAALQMYRLNEIEVSNNRVSGAVQKALSTFERTEERFELFKDNMGMFSNDVHKVNAEFAKYEQIADELRAADSYKAHDILDIRESVMNVENRVNGMYRVMDEGTLSVRNEVSDIIQRLCIINKLVC